MFRWNRSSTNQKSSTKDKKHIGLQEIKGCNNSDRIGDVIFVHGLGGNLRSTWHPEELQDDNFWLNWLSQDQTDIGIWSFGYEAEPFEWRGEAMPLFDQASNLLEWLETKGLSERPVIFVTHSLGGLLVKEMLKTAQTFKKQKLIEQIKGIIFLATPHTGSHLANLITNIGTLTRTTISVEELKSHAPQLRALNEWYRENVRGFGIATKVYYETRSVHGILVVDKDSANPGIEGVKPVAIPEDHITIAKPSSKNHLVYIGVARFILDNFKPYFNTSDSIPNDFTDESFTIDSADTIQTKRAQLRKNENDLRLLQEQEFNYGTSLRSPQEEIHFKEQYISALRQSIREDLNRLSPLPPRRYGRFIGRRQNIDSIINTLNDFETHPIIAIDGLGGVGKTALAREVAQRALESEVFAAIVWESAKPEEFTGTDLQPQFTAAVDFDNLLDLIGRKLGYFEVASQKSTEDKRKLVSRILNESSERYLVVVDNLETVKGYRDLVNNLNGMFTRSKAILTTRKKITEFRHVYSLSLRGMERNESVEFLRSLASEKGESGDIILFAEEQKLIKVHEATGGLPLAIELVVGQATRSSLDRVLNLLQSVNFQAVENPESAEDVYSKFFKFIYWDSWSQLSDEARELLISLGAFDLTEGSDIDELTIVSGLQPGVIDNASGELMEYSLIHRAIKDGQISLFLHPLTYRFVQDDLVRA